MTHISSCDGRFARVASFQGEISDSLQPEPERLDTGFAVALASEESARCGDPSDHLIECGRHCGDGLFPQHAGRLPFVGLEERLGWQIRTRAAQPHQAGNPPRHHQEYRQRPFQPCHRAQLQGSTRQAFLIT
jgi:hypothetical protein